MRAYFDHNATTPLDPAAADVMVRVLREQFGNASSVHRFGQRARQGEQVTDFSRERRAPRLASQRVRAGPLAVGRRWPVRCADVDGDPRFVLGHEEGDDGQDHLGPTSRAHQRIFTANLEILARPDAL
jgi:hypothetical protein